ncbi:hypothetical protein [Roseibacillus ishigakijimensis]|uniref:SH3 domain-containing protein n=1 Tax=Roseibacillus ishigakijimensis TaxID=454146 RepID=A0A934RLD0_9BACT|nr:hypothetical protein [Roseibacillus ishigakijimensis]MBK1832885.1 hypothetical protein [Roseibacillus ishigakijimensis]
MTSCKWLTLAAASALVSCGQITSSLQEPISSEYSPLDGPNSPRVRSQSFQQTGPSYDAGEWVETSVPNATFFNKIPKGSATADKVLALGSPLKVVSTKGTYLKVELEGGSVGYVPAIMVAEPTNSSDSTPFLPPPPSQPLQRSSGADEFAPPSLEPAPLQDSGDSVIPPPSNYSENTVPLAPEPSPERSPGEILIPTTSRPAEASPQLTIPEPAGTIPAPSDEEIIEEPTIGIE